MLKALIIEDELPAQINLKRVLKENIDDIEVIGVANSVTSAVEWFTAHPLMADIVFMDVQLSDGMCFEIFKQIDVTAKVIITTAYDNYAVKAFKVNSIDYLLKPVDADELVEAVNRCRTLIDRQSEPYNSAPLENALGIKEYKTRFAVKLGDRIVIVPTGEIAYFYSEDKTTYIVTVADKRYIIDQSLDQVMPVLDDRNFFRLSRACIVSINSIKSVSKSLGSRLKVVLTPKTSEDVYVSRMRIGAFVKWLGSE